MKKLRSKIGHRLSKQSVWSWECDGPSHLWEKISTEPLCAKSTVENLCTARPQCFITLCQLATSNAVLQSHGMEKSAIAVLLSHKNTENCLFAGAPACSPGSWKATYIFCWEMRHCMLKISAMQMINFVFDQDNNLNVQTD